MRVQQRVAYVIHLGSPNITEKQNHEAAAKVDGIIIKSETKWLSFKSVSTILTIQTDQTV